MDHDDILCWQGYKPRSQRPPWKTGLIPLGGTLAMSKSTGWCPGSPPLRGHAADPIRCDACTETVKCSIICNRELETKCSSTADVAKHTLTGKRIFLWGAAVSSARCTVRGEKVRCRTCIVCSHSCLPKGMEEDHICTLICKCIEYTFLWKGKGV